MLYSTVARFRNAQHAIRIGKIVVLVTLGACAAKPTVELTPRGGMLLPGAPELAQVQFENSPVTYHIIQDTSLAGKPIQHDLGSVHTVHVPSTYQGSPAILIVLTQPSARGTFVDSALVRRDGLVPVWEVANLGAGRKRYDYNGAAVRRAVTAPDSAATQATTTYPFPVFDFNELDELVRSVPLRTGYHAIVPLYSEGDNALETDTVRVQGKDSTGVWNVRFADKVIIAHYGIDGVTRKIMRYDVGRHADHAHFGYVITR